jgi:hypothetical protein
MMTTILFAALLALLGWSSGYAYRTWNNPTPLEEITEGIPKKETIEEQWVCACFVDTPEAWEAVGNFFPEERYAWEHKAKRQLIRYYFDNGDTSSSSHIFWEFALLSGQAEDRMLGFAGLAWCAAVIWPDIKTSENYLDEYEYIRVYYAPDELCDQIHKAATELIQQKKRELPAGE